MAHESFESESIAAILNRDFVPVKVDREERPDVDVALASVGLRRLLGVGVDSRRSLGKRAAVVSECKSSGCTVEQSTS